MNTNTNDSNTVYEFGMFCVNKKIRIDTRSMDSNVIIYGITTVVDGVVVVDEDSMYECAYDSWCCDRDGIMAHMVDTMITACTKAWIATGKALVWIAEQCIALKAWITSKLPAAKVAATVKACASMANEQVLSMHAMDDAVATYKASKRKPCVFPMPKDFVLGMPESVGTGMSVPVMMSAC